MFRQHQTIAVTALQRQEQVQVRLNHIVKIQHHKLHGMVQNFITVLIETIKIYFNI